MYIESPQNPRVKVWSQLKTKKGRQTTGLFLVEGERLVSEVLRSSLRVDAVLWDVGTDELSDALQEMLLKGRIGVTELSPAAFAVVSDTVTPQGVIAVVQRPQVGDPFATEESAHGLVLDGVQDPGNMGTLLRCADAFGFKLVCAGSNTVDPYSPKAVRASMGGLFRLSVVSEDSAAFISRWKARFPNGRVAVSSANAEARCFDVDLRHPLLILIGSEAFGVSESASRLADLSVSIPIESGVESLNAAMAGSILLYESYRQRLCGVSE